MPFRVVQPPTNQEEFAELGKRLFAAAQALGIPLDPEGFLYSWVNGTRVVIEEVDDEIKGFAMLAAAGFYMATRHAQEAARRGEAGR